MFFLACFFGRLVLEVAVNLLLYPQKALPSFGIVWLEAVYTHQDCQVLRAHEELFRWISCSVVRDYTVYTNLKE